MFYNHRTAAAAKNYPAPNVSRAKAEKPCCRPRIVMIHSLFFLIHSVIEHWIGGIQYLRVTILYIRDLIMTKT